jgi:uncharacterized membrane protein
VTDAREQLRQETRRENRWFAVLLVVGIVTCLGVGIILGRFVTFHT